MLLQLILVVIAWRRGWKAKSLIPLAGAVAAGFLMGLFGAFDEYSLTGELSLALLIPDLLAIIALITMVIVRPEERRVDDNGFAQEPDHGIEAEDEEAMEYMHGAG